MNGVVAPHSDAGPDGVAGPEEPMNHGWLRRSDIPGRSSGSNTRTRRSSVINSGISLTFDIDLTLCSRVFFRGLVAYDAPVDWIKMRGSFTVGLTYLASVPIPEGVAQAHP